VELVLGIPGTVAPAEIGDIVEMFAGVFRYAAGNDVDGCDYSLNSGRIRA
jgi:hypothetical protein